MMPRKQPRKFGPSRCAWAFFTRTAHSLTAAVRAWDAGWGHHRLGSSVRRYQARLTKLIENFRADLAGGEDVPFVLGMLPG
jgi:hypothetical protein